VKIRKHRGKIDQEVSYDARDERMCPLIDISQTEPEKQYRDKVKNQAMQAGKQYCTQQ
jgi:hypothetical protein